MQWLLYALAAGIAFLAARKWIDYMNRAEILAEDQRRLGRSIQQGRLAIEECQRREAVEAERVGVLEEEATALRSDLAESRALLGEMVRKEQRRNPEAFSADAELSSAAGTGPC